MKSKGSSLQSREESGKIKQEAIQVTEEERLIHMMLERERKVVEEPPQSKEETQEAIERRIWNHLKENYTEKRKKSSQRQWQTTGVLVEIEKKTQE